MNAYPTIEPDDNLICSTCGTQYAGTDHHICFICSDERQYIPPTGQAWTSHRRLLQDHQVAILQLEKNLYQLTVSPAFGIGQRQGQVTVEGAQLAALNVLLGILGYDAQVAEFGGDGRQ